MASTWRLSTTPRARAALKAEAAPGMSRSWESKSRYTLDSTPLITRSQEPRRKPKRQVTRSNRAGSAYATRSRPSPSQIVWLNRQGEEMGEFVESREEILSLELSRDERLVAATLSGGSNTNIWIYDFVRGVREPFTTSTDIDRDPIWSPSGGSIAYVSRRLGQQTSLSGLRR